MIRNYKFYIVIIIALFFTSFLLLNSTQIKVFNNKTYHSYIINIMSELNIGDEREKIEKIMCSFENSQIRLVKEADKKWVIETPLEFGASNWILIIDFYDNKITSLRIRTEDSVLNKPHDAPPDKG